MSGGSMDYAFLHMNEAAEHVREYLKEIMCKDDSEFGFEAGRCPPECRVDPAFLKMQTVRYLCEAWMAIDKAAIYAKRVEWLESGDDGYFDFVSRTKEELAASGHDPNPLACEGLDSFCEKHKEELEDGTEKAVGE